MSINFNTMTYTYNPAKEKVVPKDAVVLDLSDLTYATEWGYVVESIREAAVGAHADITLPQIADQIEAQTKPARIAEPSKYGVVRDAKGHDWVRTGPTQYSSREWMNQETGALDDWDEIKDPTLVRPGI